MEKVISNQALNALLESLGIQMDDAKKTVFSEHLQETLAERVGLAIAELLDDEELAEYLELTEKDDPGRLNSWLKEHVPDLDEVISDEIDILLGDIAEHSDNI